MDRQRLQVISNAHAGPGFSLVELLIVLAIIAITTSFAIPSYVDYVRRSKLVEAVMLLEDYRSKMETFFADTGSYGNGSCGVALPQGRFFSFKCDLSSPSQFVAYATSRADSGLGGDGSYEYAIDSFGSKRTMTFRGNPSGAHCWLFRGDEC
ncbi:MAG: hypothetical protein DI596_02945 [Azospira oryzae]|nr:MAG: hypothetical protein DI596_02945 [Azospira oryzae]PZP81978.1 MAG: hypothetical protein DI593_02945 [Azospira oryzae]